MKFFIALSLGLLSILGTINAECPNACNGNGICTNYSPVYSSGMDQFTKVGSTSTTTALGYDTAVPKKDTCTCFTENGHDGSKVFAWKGADCSIRVCPHGPAFGVHKRNDLTYGLSSNDHAAMEECSGVGTCDEVSGKCNCYDGYSGEACQRTVCHNDCSGAGTCKTLAQIVVDVKDNSNSYYIDTTSHLYSGFDSTQSRGCVCDKNRAGPDCSIKLCPSGSDAMGGDGASKGRTCSGRGKCDENGTCKCFNGYYGTKCESQTTQTI